ncbi:DNA primase DnaG [Haladaptatus sp. T7]|uniref:DNA primase DnaG n=1 Tax=Haladaptatus sp. T7 TaxID=2029368 RepID=UPI0021A254AB|nr:DNA primase DnaG [Haladaptatus sp. T7]GKZ13120.1 DNA primase [Haladaptatus sp. T7]
MDDTAKYLIHADITADGVVERSDVVGAIFGQTEGLLGDDLDLRDLQQSSKVGRIDVHIESEHGQSFGTITIASSLDKVETAILAASLETIERVGPCRASVSIASIEDVRAAKRREVVDRAKDLLSSSFDDSVMTSQEILDEVRQSIRVEDITEYEGFPAGPNVTDSDAIIVVEGRADVLTLLRYGIKNAIAVEGTNVPDTVADLTQERTTTAFLDADRGGDLILKELDQVGDIDYVAVAPRGTSVEDLSRDEVMASLRQKRRFERFDSDGTVMAATDGSTLPAPETESETVPHPMKPSGEADRDEPERESEDGESGRVEEADAPEEPDSADEIDASTADSESTADDSESDAAEHADELDASETVAESRAEREPMTLRGHAKAVIGGKTDTVRLLDDDFGVLADAPVDEAFATIEDSATVPHAVVIDGSLSQRILDVSAQRGVEQIIAREEGEFVKKPTTVRIIIADDLLNE